VGDVSAWLDSLALGQYKDAFADAAIDGAFLCELSDEDLRNTLGIEHALHRKKIITSTVKLRAADEDRKAAKLIGATAGGGGGGGGGGGLSMAGGAATLGGGLGGSMAMSGAPRRSSIMMPGGAAATMAAMSAGGAGATLLQEAAEAGAAGRATARDAGVLRLDELMSWVRHNKGKLIGDALAPLPDVRFDRSLVKTPYLEGFGSQYIDMLAGPAFHVNKADDKGNTLLLVAAQNGRQKLAQLLVRKGANANHQNALGNTAMHYAMAYQFHELAAWLVDPSGGGASDELLNSANMGPYDGLASG
jgi:hypothetical protein